MGRTPQRSAPAMRGSLALAGTLGLACLLAVAGIGASPVSADPIATSTTDLQVSATTVQTHHPLTLTATVASDLIPGATPTPDPSATSDPTPAPTPPTAPTPTGTVVFQRELNGVAVDYPAVTLVDGVATLTIPSLAVGSQTFRATYSGDTDVAGSVSADAIVTVTVDQVQASGVGITPTSFYPVKDNYRDTVTVRGTRAEPISVSIAVKNSANKTVRAYSRGRATGAYSWTWNGRNASGTLQPAGTYVVWQTLKDAAGTTKVVKSTLKLSWKKLVWSTKAITKSFAQRSYLTTGIAGWSFLVPSATSYGTLTVKTYARGYDTYLAARNGSCGGGTWTNYACYDAVIRFNSGSWAWRTLTTPGKTHVSNSHYVRVLIVTGGGAQVQKVSISLRYAVLR